jgi:hypothetical protein
MRKTTAAVVAGVAGAAAVALMPGASAYGAGQCSDQMAGNLQVYYACISDVSARCTESGGAFPHTLGIVSGHITCIYPDGSRDECDYNGIPGYGDGNCDNFPA